ncbi:hypothetical protein M569_16197, partial [Genlisea aurea]
MGNPTEEELYATFLDRVKRTIYVDDLTPHATETVLKAAFDQYGDVKTILFIPNYFEPKNSPRAALVEMDSPKQAEELIVQMRCFPFMISGSPRPAKGLASMPEMFGDRPKKPGRKIFCRWLDPESPQFEVAREIKRLVKKHFAEAAFLLQ